ncbi:MAG: GTP-binding protein [Acidobacteriota bacterium]
MVLNGFLGAGKTTLLRSLLSQSSQEDLSVGVIVNDMSELDVDGELVANSDVFGKESHGVESIYSCVLSSRKGLRKLERALERMLSNRRPDLILVETSGSGHPLPLVEFFRPRTDLELTGVLTLVDAAMLAEDYDDGKQLFPLMQRNMQHQLRDTTNLLVEQIMFCSHLIVTKADRLRGGKLQDIAQSIHSLNPFVSVLSVPWGKLPIADVLDMPGYDYHRVAQLVEELKPVLESESHDERPYDLATRVIKDDRPFHPRRLWEACHHHLGQQIYRSKGFFWLASRDDVSLLWSQAAGAVNLELLGYWRAGVLENGRHGLSQEEVEALRERLGRESGRFGDRHCHLTIIGHKSQVDSFSESIDRCFLTEEEIEYWQSGGQFPDPWPQTLSKV